MDDRPGNGAELEVFATAANWKAYFRSHIEESIGTHVLEVGAGIGATTAALGGRAIESWVCLEPDDNLRSRIDRAIAAGLLPPSCSTRAGTIHDLAPNELFDTILYIDVLEHIRDDAGELRAAGDHLTTAGVVVVLGPAHSGLYSPFDAAIGDFRRYDTRDLTALTPPELVLESAIYLDTLGMVPSLINRVLLKQALPSFRQIAFWDRWLVPVTRHLDRLLGYRIGRSVVCTWRRKPLP